MAYTISVIALSFRENDLVGRTYSESAIRTRSARAGPSSNPKMRSARRRDLGDLDHYHGLRWTKPLLSMQSSSL
jgi:hypothetical protein